MFAAKALWGAVMSARPLKLAAADALKAMAPVAMEAVPGPLKLTVGVWVSAAKSWCPK